MSTSSATLAAQPARRGSSRLARRKALEGYLYISPFLIGFLIFTAYPLLASFYLSFTSYNILSAPTWIGLENYQRAFTQDPQFWASLGRTIRYALLVVPIGLICSLLAAMLLNHGHRVERRHVLGRHELEIEGMSCGHCVAAVSEALTELPGVSVDQVRIGAAQVTYHPDQVSPEQIVLAVEDAGYAAHAKG